MAALTHSKQLPDNGFLIGLTVAIAAGAVLWAILITLDVLAAYALALR